MNFKQGFVVSRSSSKERSTKERAAAIFQVQLNSRAAERRKRKGLEMQLSSIQKMSPCDKRAASAPLLAQETPPSPFFAAQRIKK